MEMPPGKLERAKTLAWDRDLDFRSSHRLCGRVFFTRASAEPREEASQAHFLEQSARPLRASATQCWAGLMALGRAEGSSTSTRAITGEVPALVTAPTRCLGSRARTLASMGARDRSKLVPRSQSGGPKACSRAGDGARAAPAGGRWSPGRPIAVREHERLGDVRLVHALCECLARGPAADGKSEWRRDVDAGDSRREAHSRSSALTSRPITASLSPCVVVAIPRIEQTTPDLDAVLPGRRLGSRAQ